MRFDLGISDSGERSLPVGLLVFQVKFSSVAIEIKVDGKRAITSCDINFMRYTSCDIKFLRCKLVLRHDDW